MYACVLSVFFSCFLGYMCVVLALTANFDLIFKILQYYLFNMFFYMTLLIINKRNYKINCARARVWVCVCNSMFSVIFINIILILIYIVKRHHDLK